MVICVEREAYGSGPESHVFVFGPKLGREPLHLPLSPERSYQQVPSDIEEHPACGACVCTFRHESIHYNHFFDA